MANLFRVLFLMILLLAPSVARAEADITIRFGSYCCGTDVVTADKIMDYLKYSDQIRSWKKSDDRFGKEGEYNLEVNLAQEADRAMIYDDLRKMIPRYSDKAPTSIEGKGFARFETGMSPPEKKKKVNE